MNDAKDRLARAVDDARQGVAEQPEADLWRGGYSARAMCGTWFAAATVTAGGLAAMLILASLRNSPTAWYGFFAVVLLVWLGPSLVALYRKLVHYYELTSQRLKHRDGFLVRTMHRVELIDVDDVIYRQGPIQQLLGVGDISIRSTDNTHPELVLRGIADVRKVANQIDDARRAERRRRGLHIESV